MTDQDAHWMHRAIELAKRGQGSVEPNPMVGCVLVRDGELIGEGFHEKFGENHAEVNAINSVNSELGAKGATAYVTLEPCSHVGKTPPCANALIEAEIERVFIAQEDPFAEVSGNGIARLREAGIKVEFGLLEKLAKELNAPYIKRITKGLPWIIAKYAMTLDGKIATYSGDSKWISSEESREIVHRLRGRVDGIMVGANTAIADDPLLTARPPGYRTARRFVIDSRLRIPVDCQLVKTAHDVPVDILTYAESDPEKVMELAERDVQVHLSTYDDPNERLFSFLKTCVTDFQTTNVLVEGGGQLLGSLRDLGLIDELHVFMGPRVIGGSNAISPVQGSGVDKISDGDEFKIISSQIVDTDVYVRAVRKTL